MQAVAKQDLVTNIESFLDRAEGGEEIVITKSGRVIARLVPEHKEEVMTRHNAAVLGMLKLNEDLRREGKALTVKEILELRNEGRR